MSETYETPRGGRKASKLPRYVHDQAADVSSTLKKMSVARPSPASSLSSISSKIPLLRSNSDKFSTPKRLKLDVFSLESLKDDISQGRVIGSDNHRVMQLVKEITGVWLAAVMAMATAYNGMVQFLIDSKVNNQPELSSTTTSIKQKIEAAKSATNTKFTLIARNLEESKTTESSKHLLTIKLQNQKITGLGRSLKRTEATLEEFKIKLQQEKDTSASIKQALEYRLKETSEALEKALAEIAAKTNEDVPPQVLISTDASVIVDVAKNKKKNDKEDSGKQVHLLKLTVKKLETNVDQLSKQNENLRDMLSSAKRRFSKNESLSSKKKIEHTLQKILSEEQQNLEKLTHVIQIMKEHHNASRDQQKQIETQVQLLQSEK